MGKRILILQTGGTVCSNVKQNDISLSATADTDLLEKYQGMYGGDDFFTVECPFYMLSEDSTPAQIERLLQAVGKALAEPWDGIIILHGTDTLPYSAAAVGMCFGNSGKCIVFSSANITPDQPGSNALPNFRNAVLCIKENLKGVFCTYRNSCGTDFVFLGTRLNMADGYTDDFSDYFHQPYAVLKNEKIEFNTLCNMQSNCSVVPKLQFNSKKEILLLTPYPGLSYTALDLDHFSAILHLTYHSGTACTAEYFDLTDFATKCNQKNLPLYLAPLKKQKKFYESTAKILAAGAKPLHNISPVAAYIKLWLAYNQAELSPEAFLERTYYYETVE